MLSYLFIEEERSPTHVENQDDLATEQPTSEIEESDVTQVDYGLPPRNTKAQTTHEEEPKNDSIIIKFFKKILKK